MDTIVNTALEEICFHGKSGLSISKLWQKLQSSITSQGLTLCPKVKYALWSNLVEIPGLKFEAKGVVYSSRDDCVRLVEQSERLDLKIVAPEHLRDGLVGVYDIEASESKLTLPERRALDRLTIARENGITQSELAKEFGMKGNDMFYILRKLECRGLIVRQSTVIKTKDMTGEGDSKNGSVVTTNMLHLSRYAKHLGCQQRLEITRGDKSLVDDEIADGRDADGDDVAEESVKEDVHVKDFLPALKAICDKLAKAEGKVLVVSDIKLDLGYRGTSGHRAWRHIVHKLKEASMVEEFLAEVDRKEVNCLRLLKGFSPKHFESRSLVRGCNDLDKEEALKFAKRGQISNLILELPLEHQVYDMINAEGCRGLPITEVCKRLGLRNKPYYNRLNTIFRRFGIHMETELMNRAKGYRVWTPGNRNPGASNVTLNKQKVDFSENSGITPLATDLEFQENSVRATEGADASVPEGNGIANSQNGNTGTQPKVSDDLLLDGKDESSPLCLSYSPDSAIMVSSTTSNADVQIVSAAPSNSTPVEMLPLALSTPPRRQSDPRYPCVTFDAASAQREQWILKILQEEKFLIKPDLHRRLESLVKEKTTMMDRKTLDRCLNKLSREGQCKFFVVNVPALTNCNQSRRVQVVLHPSVSSVSADQVHEKFRSFEKQIRSQCSPQLKKGQSIPQLNGVFRINNGVKLDVQAERAEVMRANGFVLAKMVRSKLLHIYLWEYVNSLPVCDDVFSSSKHGHNLKNPHSSCKPIDLDAAIKAMPLELFLQIVGSTHKFEDMIEKCRNRVCLSDLPLREYKCLMDIRATGRLSWLVDILRRLKLIRLVSSGHLEDTEKLHTTLTRALELKPYIEEPVCSMASSHGFVSPDLRPQIRHDFILSGRKAVEEYWNTLEYCYSAADRKSALHAFPGSAVNEVFLSRSWASVRVMTADQRTELLKRVVTDGPRRKLSFKECEEIAKDLNLTLQQVLRVYHDKRQQRLTRFERVSNAKMDEIQPLQCIRTSSLRKRKRPLKKKPLKHAEAGAEFGHPNHQRLSQIDEEQSSSLSTSQQYICNLEGHHVGDDTEAAEESESHDDGGVGHAFLGKCALSRETARKGKFSWTDDADRKLVIEYARHRAALGAKFNRVDWGKLPNLPAPPSACRRRMAALKNSPQFRKALMKLCNVLTQRYVDYIKKFQNKTLSHGSHQVMLRDCSKHTTDFLSQELWDDFDDANVKMALDEALRYKKISKLETLKEVKTFFDKRSDVNTDARHVNHSPESVFTASGGQYVEIVSGKAKVSCSPLNTNRIPQKYVKLAVEGIAVRKQLHESVAVANAAELFKLIFLCSSKSTLVPTLLAETLRRYSEHDLFSAFNYLREKKVLIGGHAHSPFVLSQIFLRNIYYSPFPINTGKRAAKFASWLCEKEKELISEGVDLPMDLQCGDVYHLCGLLSSGELSITPFLPNEGVGEVEDSRTSKRKYDDGGFSGIDRYKKLKTSTGGESETCLRREKGFPGIRLCLRHATLSRIKTMDSLKDVDDKFTPTLSVEEHQSNSSTLCVELGSVSFESDDHVNELHDSGVPDTAVSSTKSPWEAMTSYAKHVCLLGSSPEQNLLLYRELFKTVYSAIQMAGDQGLCMKDISEILKMQEEKLLAVVDVLEAFGRVLKVNAFASIRVVDSLYRSKYFLTPVAAIHQDAILNRPRDSKAKFDEDPLTINQKYHEDVELQGDVTGNSDEVHRITILNLPKEVAEPSSEKQIVDDAGGYLHTKASSPTRNHQEEPPVLLSTDSHVLRPILPWLNGDGTTNEHVYKGLVRRCLGIVMQNPGIQEDDIISHMHVLNPQSCRSLLNLMVLDNHIFVRKFTQAKPATAPTILGSILGSHFKKSQLISREHFFANSSSIPLL